MLRGTKVEINENNYKISPGIRKVLGDQSYDTAKSMTDKDKQIFRDILQKTGYQNQNRKPTKSHLTGRDRYIKYDPDNNFSRILKIDTKLKGRGIEKIIIPSIITDIYTRLGVLLGPKLSGHTGTLTEASNPVDQLHNIGEIQNKQQYRNALNKFSTD